VKGKIIVLLSAVLLSSSSLVAQEINNTNLTGFPQHAILNGSNVDTVQMNNGNVHIEIPLWTAQGRGGDSWGAIVYDSKGWSLNGYCDQYGNCNDIPGYSPSTTPGVRFTTSLNYVTYTEEDTAWCGTYPSQGDTGYIGNLTLIDSHGTQHHFYYNPYQYPAPCPTKVPLHIAPGVSQYADDGSGWMAVSDGNWN
jgi:hypothetical protein